MHIDVKIQSNNENTLEDVIKNNLLANPKKVYIYSGIFKESGLELIKNSLIISKAEKIFVIGIDKKNTTKNMLETLLDCTKKVYIYDNNGISEFDASTYIFEYTNKVIVVSTTANLSEGGIRDNFSVYSLIEYDLKDSNDKVEYQKNLKIFLNLLDNEQFFVLKSSMIQELADSKKIFTTKQYVHSDVKSIAELIGEKAKSKSDKKSQSLVKDDDIFDDISIELPKIDLDGKSVDIEIPESEIENEAQINKNSKTEVQKQNDIEKSGNVNNKYQDIAVDDEKIAEDLNDSDFDKNDTLDIENMLFTKADSKIDDIKIDIPKSEESNDKIDNKKKDALDSVLKSKKIDIVNISNLLIHLEKKVTKGQDLNCLKIPNYINETVPNFFDLTQKGEYVEEDGNAMRVKRINLDVVDVKNNQKYNDLKAEIIHRKGQSYIVIKSNIFEKIDYQELDIARIIKLSGKVYHIEIVSKDIDEYKIWNKLCVNKIKLSQRKYGLM